VDELGCFENEKVALINLAEKLPGIPSGSRWYTKELPPVLGVLTTLKLPGLVRHPRINNFKFMLRIEHATLGVVWGEQGEAYARHFSDG
jgi:hypothetical protein